MSTSEGAVVTPTENLYVRLKSSGWAPAQQLPNHSRVQRWDGSDLMSILTSQGLYYSDLQSFYRILCRVGPISVGLLRGAGPGHGYSVAIAGTHQLVSIKVKFVYIAGLKVITGFHTLSGPISWT